jgi:hypothetical protein
MDLFRQSIFFPSIIKSARRLGARVILRKEYYRWDRPSDGTLNSVISGVLVEFVPRNPEELCVLEPAGGAGGDSRVHLFQGGRYAW